jgi:hypothetical protein
VELYKPDAPQTIPGPDFGLVPYILVDRVHYSDSTPWPAAADGGGPSLQRINVAAYGNEATNWFASGFTPGRFYLSNQPPVIIQQPSNQTVNIGDPALFTVFATGASPLSYHWRFNGTELVQATNALLVLTNVQPTNAGNYTVVITNNVGSTTSLVAVLTVLDADTDHDGLPDQWELDHGLKVGVNDAQEDPDGDGMTNLEEYIAGTDPKSAASVLRLGIVPGTNSVLLSFSAQPDIGYTLLWRNNMTSGTWQSLSNIATQSVLRTVTVRDNAPGAFPQRIYRVVTPQLP